jgi:poly-gamma-glutamate capsule biosynthesis protein CapA/YwtB (metallophosphatase superfamily)
MSKNDIKILLTGDFCPINRIEQLALKHDFVTIFNDFADVFQGNDLNITDLECPLTESASARQKIGPHQKAHTYCINILKHADISLVAMANNHIMDFGKGGAFDTIEICRTNNISTVGIGKNQEDAARPYSLETKGRRVAIMNYADNEFLTTPDGSHMCNPINPVQLFYDITNARSNHDYVIAIIHAGNEFYELPSPRTRKLYRYIIDVGADAVISHHTHAYSGYEIYNSKPIFYGLGNFIYDWPGKINIRWNRGYVVRLLLSDRVNFEIIPLKQNNENPGLFHLDAKETEEFSEEMKRLNLIIADDNQLESEFQKYCNSVFPMYDAYIEPYFGKYITALKNRSLFPKLMTRRKRLLLLNISRCESHRDVLIRMLTKYE